MVSMMQDMKNTKRGVFVRRSLSFKKIYLSEKILKYMLKNTPSIFMSSSFKDK